MNEELEEIKERLMAERRRIFEESEKSNFDQGDLSLKIHELKTREEVLNQEVKKLERIQETKKKEIDTMRKEIDGQAELLKLEKQSLDETKKDFEKKMEDLQNEKK